MLSKRTVADVAAIDQGGLRAAGRENHAVMIDFKSPERTGQLG
jgi:hypothetical protein